MVTGSRNAFNAIEKEMKTKQTMDWEKDLILYLTSPGDRRRTIHFIKNLISKERIQWEAELIKELNSRRFCVMGRECHRDDKLHDRILDEFISLLKSKEKKSE